MQTERENSGGGLWLRWVLVNAAGLATGYALFAFIQNILGGEQGTLRHDISSMAGLTVAGAVIGLLQYLALRNHVQPGRSRRAVIALVPVVSFIVISSISVWEIALKVKRQKLVIPLAISDYADRLQRIGSLGILPVDDKSWLDNLGLPWEHRDPADRIIVALATRFDCSLVTSDRVIADYYPGTVW